jgi:hypothetical protein
MTVTSKEIIDSIVKNHTLSINEADWRGVCSRSYYAIYEDGKGFHEQLPSPGTLRAESKGGMHRDLIEQLCMPTLKRSDPNFMKSMKIGYVMRTLHDQRIKADYFRAQPITRIDADNCIAQANGVLAELSGVQVLPPAVDRSPMQHPSVPPYPEKGGRPTLTRIK